MATMAASSSSSSLFRVYPNRIKTTTLFHHPPVSNLRFTYSSSSDMSLRFDSGRVQLTKAAAAANKVVMDETTASSPAAAAANKLVTTVDVNLGDRSYPIYIGSGLLDQPDLLQRSLCPPPPIYVYGSIHISYTTTHHLLYLQTHFFTFIISPCII